MSNTITTENADTAALLTKLCKAHPDRAAVIDIVGTRLRQATFAELRSEVEACARVLTEAGVQRRDLVLIYVPLQRELISLLLAVFRLGAQALFIDPTYGPAKVWHCLRLAKPKFLIFDSKLQALTLAAPLLSCAGIDGLICFSQNGDSSDIIKKLKIAKRITNVPTKFAVTTKLERGTQADSQIAPELPALITFTSGSTGKPKGIVRSHSFLNRQAQLLAKTLPETRHGDDSGYRVLTTLPMFILAALAAGQTAIIPAKENDGLLQQLQHLAIDRLLCAPKTLENICSMLAQKSIVLPDLKQVAVGGGPVFAGLLSQVSRAMPGAEIITVYGSTEAEPICHRTISKHSNHDAAVFETVGRGLPLGRPIEEIELCTIDWQALGERRSLTQTEFDSIKLPPYKEGEIVVRGDHVIRGYLGAIGDQETKINVAGEIFHRTGDAGYIDRRGEVFLTGRAAYGVKNQSGTVYPLSVELIAMENDGVERCAFVGVKGKSVLALKLKEGNNQPQIIEQLKKMFSRAEIEIDRMVVLDALPMDERHGSKIVYGKLKQRLIHIA